MLHSFQLNGYNIVMDVNSGAVHVVDEMVYDMIQLLDAEFLARCKKTAYLINTSRGPVVDDQALADALNSGRIAGAGLDVLSVEPPKSDNPLLTAKNCLITPHIAWAAYETRARLLGIFKENIKAFCDGHPIHVVN